MVKFTKEISYYFSKPGKQNTTDTINFALDVAKTQKIKNIVVASSSGESALKIAKAAKRAQFNLIVVSTSPASKKHAEWLKNKLKLEKLGVKTLTSTSPFAGIARSINARWGGVNPGLLTADTLRTFSEGTKVGIEIMLMVTDAGLIEPDSKTITIAGTGAGLDTAMVVKSTFSFKFFELAINKIICKPITDGVKHSAR
jgi:uncharacterized protein